MDITNIIKGNKRFRELHFPKLEDRFDDLVENGQKPKILFICCSDSRVVPDLIVDSKPGDLFVLRNIGNFVPPYKNDTDFHGSSAAIEYAVSVLEVEDIIVCGHSHCGACASLYQDLKDEENLVHVNKWLELGKNAKVNIDIQTLKKKKRNKILRKTEKDSIKYQLSNLLTYPDVLRKIKSKKLNIHGWYYKIEDGIISCYDKENNNFKDLK
ncbi:MAG: carbonic anhydrase [Campylobacterota bacterium]|nr:carbonic anhydrase [Campylobacterota bacterium]